MSGDVRIGFDRSISASLKAQIKEGAIEPGLQKSITTALTKYSVIKIAGTMKEPKYSIQPDMTGAMEEFQNIFYYEN